jgi:hypothetical protein
MAMVCTSSADDSLMAGNTMTGDAKLFCQLALALPALQQVPDRFRILMASPSRGQWPRAAMLPFADLPLTASAGY